MTQYLAPLGVNRISMVCPMQILLQDDGEMRKARKAHKCLECHRVIIPGETYKYATGLFDGYWDEIKTCTYCLAAGAWLIIQWGGWPNGDLAEELRDHAEEYGEVRFGLLRSLIGVRRGWKRFDDNGLMPLPIDVRQPEYVS